MKKVLALGLSLLLIVTAILALSLSGSAAASNATSVKVTPTSGSATTLNATTTSVAAGSGTVSFDASKGELTLDNASNLKQITATGNVTVIVKNVNTFTQSGTSFAMNITGSVTFTGSGTINFNGGRGVYASSGDLTATDSVKLNIFVTDYPYSVRSGGSTDGNMVFEKNAQVHIKVTGLGLYQHTSTNDTGTTTIRDSASVTVESSNSSSSAVSLKNGLTVNGGSLTVETKSSTAVSVNCGNFKQTAGSVSVSANDTSAYAFQCTGFEKTGGDMTVTVVGDDSTYKLEGININGNAAGSPDVATFSGGNLTVDMSSVYSGATDVHAIYLHYVPETNFSGTNLTLNVTTPKAGSYSSAILTGWSQEINITGGNIVSNLNANTTGLICPRYAQDDFVLTVSGGTLTGTAPSLLNTDIGTDGSNAATVTTSVAVNILDGAKINLATSGGVFSSSMEYAVDTSGSTASFAAGFGLTSAQGLVTANMADDIYFVTVVDANGTSVTLNKTNPSLTSGGGTVTYDPATGTLTMNGATVKSVTSTVGDLKIVAVGNNRIQDNKNFVVNVSGGDLTFAGDGMLEIITNGMAVYASAGDLIAEGNIILTVSGSSTVYSVKNSNATDGDMIFRGNAKVTVNATGYRALLQNQKSPYNTDQKLLIEDNASVVVTIPNASSGNSSDYSTAILIRGMEMTGGSLELNLTGAEDASSRVLGIQVQGDNGADGAVDFLGGKLTINHVSKKPGESLAYSIYTNYSSGITFGGADVTLNLTAAKSGTTSGVICPANTPFVKMTDGTLTVNANEYTTALITPRLVNYGFTFEMTGGTLTGTAPSLFNTINDKTYEMKITVNSGAKINLATPGGALYSTGAVTINGTATFLEGCGLVTGNEYLITSNAFAPGELLADVKITDAQGTTTLNFGLRTYNGSVGQIVLDPIAKTLTFDGVVGPTSVSVPKDATIVVIGTNIINATTGAALTVTGDLTLTGPGSLELTGSTKVLSAEDLSVNGGTLRILASAGDALDVATLTVASDAKVRIFAENGTAVDVDGITLKDSAKVQIYADNGDGIRTLGMTQKNGSALTVDAMGTGLSVDGYLTLSNDSTSRIYSEALGIFSVSGGINLNDFATLSVLEDKAGAKGIVLDGATVTTYGSSAGKVFVSGTGISLNSGASAGAVNVVGGRFTVDGIPALDSSVTVTSPYIKGGEGSWNASLLEELTGSENYVLLSALKPGDSNLESSDNDLKVNYTEIIPSGMVYSLDMIWENSDLAFDYAGGSQGGWNAGEHTYGEPVGAGWVDNDLKVTVVNHSNAKVKVAMEISDGDTTDDLVVRSDVESETLNSAEGTKVENAPKMEFILTITGTPKGAVTKVATATIVFSQAD